MKIILPAIKLFTTPLLAVFLMLSLASASDDLLAFPTAEGYGRFAKGGRGGDVYHVTNLNDSGTGSLREGIRTKNAEIPRTIVFEIGGTIQLAKELRIEGIHGLTLAGQTAPGGGITLRDHVVKFIDCSNIIVRFIRFRLGDETKTSDDVISLGSEGKVCRDIIFDHVTATWGVDGIMDTDSIADFTMQWCMFGEALNDSTHYKKQPHAMLMSFRRTQGNVSVHHNLLFSSRDRHPTLGGGDPKKSDTSAIFDFRNNLIYNWEGACNLASGRFNIIGNYWRPGPNTHAKSDSSPIAPKAEAQNVTKGYLEGNFFESNTAWSEDNYTAFQWGTRGGKYVGEVTRETFILPEEITAKNDRPQTHKAVEAYSLILDHAGASKVRDAADERVISGVKDRTHRRIDSPKEVGGWPPLQSGTAPKDSDRDGMADAWEVQQNLSPEDASDRNLKGPEGYTHLERYLNALAP